MFCEVDIKQLLLIGIVLKVVDGENINICKILLD